MPTLSGFVIVVLSLFLGTEMVVDNPGDARAKNVSLIIHGPELFLVADVFGSQHAKRVVSAWKVNDSGVCAGIVYRAGLVLHQGARRKKARKLFRVGAFLQDGQHFLARLGTDQLALVKL